MGRSPYWRVVSLAGLVLVASLLLWASTLFTDGFESNDFTAWTGTSGSPTISTSQAAHGTHSMNFTSASAQYAYFGLSTDLTNGNTAYVRAYIYLSSQGTQNGRILSLMNSSFSQNMNIRWTGAVSPKGFIIQNVVGSTSLSTTQTYNTNTWYRIEAKWVMSHTAGQYELKTFTLDGTTPIETLTSGSTENTWVSGTEDVHYFAMGNIAGIAATGFMDDGGIGNSAYLGPVGQVGNITETDTIGSDTIALGHGRNITETDTIGTDSVTGVKSSGTNKTANITETHATSDVVGAMGPYPNSFFHDDFETGDLSKWTGTIGTAPTVSTTQFVTPTHSLRPATGGVQTDVFTNLATDKTNGATIKARFLVYIDSAGSANARIFEMNSPTGVTLASIMWMPATSKFRVNDDFAGLAGDTTQTYSTGQWYRFEVSRLLDHGTLGQWTASIYSLLSTTPIETVKANSTGYQTWNSNTDNIHTFVVGNDSGSTMTMYADDVWLANGAQALIASPTQNLTTSDSLAANAGRSGNLTETLTTSGTLRLGVVYGAPPSEVLATTDLAAQSSLHAPELTENLTTTPSLAVSSAHQAAMSESLTTTGSVTASGPPPGAKTMAEYIPIGQDSVQALVFRAGKRRGGVL